MKPFPIKAAFRAPTGDAVACEILNLTLQGLILETGPNLLKPMDKVYILFRLPVLNFEITEQVIIVRFYDKFRPAHNGKPEGRIHQVEAHFTQLSDQNKARINQYLNKIPLRKV